jgi:predicted unusual protein kinase regulating ubiquinone biosynthesis (AarF/ABC1/UbiB family)
VHRLLNADPNPGNFLVEEQPDGSAHVWCLDFGCALELPEPVRDADRELWWALVDEDSASAAERFRMGLGKAGLLARTDRMATTVHREWEKALAAPPRPPATSTGPPPTRPSSPRPPAACSPAA